MLTKLHYTQTYRWKRVHNQTPGRREIMSNLVELCWTDPADGGHLGHRRRQRRTGCHACLSVCRTDHWRHYWWRQWTGISWTSLTLVDVTNCTVHFVCFSATIISISLFHYFIIIVHFSLSLFFIHLCVQFCSYLCIILFCLLHILILCIVYLCILCILRSSLWLLYCNKRVCVFHLQLHTANFNDQSNICLCNAQSICTKGVHISLFHPYR